MMNVYINSKNSKNIKHIFLFMPKKVIDILKTLIYCIEQLIMKLCLRERKNSCSWYNAAAETAQA
jgi:hypothetical protein